MSHKTSMDMEEMVEAQEVVILNSLNHYGACIIRFGRYKVIEWILSRTERVGSQLREVTKFIEYRVTDDKEVCLSTHQSRGEAIRVCRDKQRRLLRDLSHLTKVKSSLDTATHIWTGAAQEQIVDFVRYATNHITREDSPLTRMTRGL